MAILRTASREGLTACNLLPARIDAIMCKQSETVTQSSFYVHMCMCIIATVHHPLQLCIIHFDQLPLGICTDEVNKDTSDKEFALQLGLKEELASMELDMKQLKDGLAGVNGRLA